MLQYAIKNEKNTNNLSKRYKEGQKLKGSLSGQESKPFSIGLLFKSNRVTIDPELLEYMEEKKKKAVTIKDVSISKSIWMTFLPQKASGRSLDGQQDTRNYDQLRAQTLVKWRKRWFPPQILFYYGGIQKPWIVQIWPLHSFWKRRACTTQWRLGLMLIVEHIWILNFKRLCHPLQCTTHVLVSISTRFDMTLPPPHGCCVVHQKLGKGMKTRYLSFL